MKPLQPTNSSVWQLRLVRLGAAVAAVAVIGGAALDVVGRLYGWSEMPAKVEQLTARESTNAAAIGSQQDQLRELTKAVSANTDFQKQFWEMRKVDQQTQQAQQVFLNRIDQKLDDVAKSQDQLYHELHHQ